MDDQNDVILGDDVADDSQAQTQSTQQASQQAAVSIDQHLWGYLQPCSAALTRIDFWKINPRYTIGRNTGQNSVVLPGFKVSNLHCTLTWDGSDQHTNVVVCDLSSNGTFINGAKIGKNQTRILREGNEIAFGTSVPQPGNGGLEDYRFIYRHTARGPPTTGLYAYYDLTQELGKGSFAVVMKAVSRASGKWYAVKMIQESRNVRSPGEQRQQSPAPNSRAALFAREITIMEKLKHPNICELKEVFYQEDSNDINLVLELVEGGDLLDYILKRNGLTEVDAQHITYQICDALSYIHSKGVAHRDLKPENVLLTKDTPPIVKVADFGLAKVVDSLTMLRTMCGTPSYLAPEVVKQENDEGYDNVVDSWSVGVIVFSMLTNASPFIEDDTQRDIRTRVAERTVDWNCLANANVSAEAQNFIQCLLEENPRQRMTLTDALNHPWLLMYTPVYNLQPHQQPPPPQPSSSTSSIPTEDFSMLSSIEDKENESLRSVVSEGMQNLQIQPSIASSDSIPGLSHGRGTSTGVKREESANAPLQRRSHLLAQAAEDGKSMPEPSWEMIAHAASQDQTAGPSNWSTKGQNKRVHSELTPLPEDAPMDVVANGASPLSDTASPAVGKGSGSGSDEDSGTAGRSTRGKGKSSATPKATRARAGKSGEAGEDDSVQPRRSGRHPQKVARHA